MGYPDELFAECEKNKLSMLACPVCYQVLEQAMRVGCPSEHELCQGKQLKRARGRGSELTG